MSKTHYFRLQPSEMAVFQAASQIYAGYVASGQVKESNESEMMKKSISAAISIGKCVEKAVISDDELASKDAES